MTIKSLFSKAPASNDPNHGPFYAWLFVIVALFVGALFVYSLFN